MYFAICVSQPALYSASIRTGNGTVWDGMLYRQFLGRLKTVPPHLFWEILCRHVTAPIWSTTCTWLSENFCNLALSWGAWFSTQNAPDRVCRPGSARTRRGAHSAPMTSWLNLRTEKGHKKEGKGRKGKCGKKGKEERKDWRGNGSGPTGTSFPHFSPGQHSAPNYKRVFC